MSAMENRAVTERVFEALGKGDLTAAQKVLGPGLQEGGAISAKAAERALPDIRVQLEDMVAEDDKVVARWTATGTQKGPAKHAIFGNVKATGKQLNVEGITILRFERGRIVEAWGVTDELGAAVQLGLVGTRA
jgi:ketosteroid isomerase-like protein